MPRRRAGSRTVRSGARRELVVVIGFGLVAMLAIGLGAAFASRSVAQSQALDDSERMTQRLADLVVGPLLAGYLEGDAEGVRTLEQAVRNRMADGYLTEVVVWSRDGLVLYSDKPGEVGTRAPLSPDVLAAIDGRIVSAFEDDAPEADAASGGAVDPRADDARYVEVYVPLRLDGRPPMAFEAYYDYQRVDEVANSLLSQTLPLVLVPLLLLQLIQVPIVLSLARRLQSHEHDRARLLEQALTASDRERVRFAADLHDGPIQDLAAISYVLGALTPGAPERETALMTRAQEALQRSIESLRTLMTDLYPPDLGSADLGDTVTALASELRTEGLDVTLDVSPVGPLDTDTATALYRVARESLVNVTKHAGAGTVSVRLGLVDPARPGGGPTVELEISDDGRGIAPDRLDRRGEGHLGLRLLADRVDALGGRLTVTTTPDHGTTVRAVLPATTAETSGSSRS
ncbi:sensor histidine kinase [Microlunatus flavus]|uniref:Oxygen sensor histidine kinase NreB n=1 Tax=Microlunatus flavus TaxID=1036181 RepID=A0A1H9J7U1_9ACTN|nr:sensor histidine kinase [Microlunatus flavus]SEQ82685.1 Histidine kinase [Microlunatus flavus]